jgi:hypothetical protein
MFTSHVRTGGQLRRFVLELLREHRPAPPLDVYLASLWQAAQAYRTRPFEFRFVAELLQAAFDTPPMPYDWDAALAQPYQLRTDHLAPANTPEYRAELDTYDYFERLIKRQITDLKRIQLQPPVGYASSITIDGQRVYWENTDVDGFLERGTTLLEESEELEDDATWRALSRILKDGQYTE